MSAAKPHAVLVAFVLAALIIGMSCAALPKRELVVQQWDRGNLAHNSAGDAQARGDHERARKLLAKALRYYARALEMNPDPDQDRNIRSHRAEALENLGRFDEALADLIRARELGLDDPETAQRIADLEKRRKP